MYMFFLRMQVLIKVEFAWRMEFVFKVLRGVLCYNLFSDKFQYSI